MSFEKDKFLEWLKAYSEYQAVSAEATRIFDGLDFKDPNVFFQSGRDLTHLFERVIDLIEVFAKDIDNLSNKDKQKAFKEGLDDMIKLPKLLEWADNLVIDAMVSSIVAKKNDAVGHDWFGDD